MKSEIIVDVKSQEISIALLEDQKLVEFQQEQRLENFSVGNIYLAKIRKIMPGLNACFVNVGHEKDAFLHFSDLGSNFFSLKKFTEILLSKKSMPQMSKFVKQAALDKEGQINNIFNQGDEVFVQIIKEPINTKGPRLTSELSFAGRYLVLLPFAEKINVSNKIKSDSERSRLKHIISTVKPPNYGVIIRTVAEGKKQSELETELKILIKKWEDAAQKALNFQQRPLCVFEETSRTVGLIRDLFNPSYENIIVSGDEGVYAEIKDYVSLIAPEKIGIVKHYKGSVPVFDNYSITKQIKASLGKTVTYKKGAYLIIEQTEALHVIDVNSGNRSKIGDGQEANALDVNLGAADEIARQLRLRDMGGIIVIDFIDMATPENRQMLYERMCQNMHNDRAKHQILPLSKFGLMQITRQRVRPTQTVKVEEECPTCGGSGKIKGSLLLIDILESKIETMVKQYKIKNITLHVHPFVYAYIDKGFLSRKLLWNLKYGFGLKVIPNQGFSFLEYKFFNSNKEEIVLNNDHEMK
jgi:ribonuclease G